MNSTSIDMLERLIQFDTTSHKSNLELIDFVDEFLADHGLEGRRVFSEDGAKANLYVTVGPMEPGGVILSGHTDVVPAEPSEWTSDPFRLALRDGRLYGRGTADMKGFCAVVLALVPEMLSRGLKKPIHIALSYDEEITCLGALSMIDEMTEALPEVSAVIIGEPSDMQIVTAHKGAYGYRTTVTGREAHSGIPHQGVSANAVAARLVVFLDDMVRENARKVDPASPFSPPYSTINAGTLRGGTACNILAGHCEFEWDLRILPGEDAEIYLGRFRQFSDELLDDMRQVSPDTDIETTERSAVPGLRYEPDGAAETLCKSLTGRNETRVTSFCTEGGWFQSRGFSTVICGPGSVDVVHRADEYVTVAEMAECESMVRNLMDRLA